MKLVGVTGTNGKTTTAYLVDSILRAAGYTTGLVGTTGYRTPKGSRSGANTTPESLDLQQMFAEVRDAGGTHAVLEASSHALAMDRLWGCHFAVAIFTNLTRDHLDYHKTFENYFAAKRHLFEGTGAGAPDVAVINADDPYASRTGGLGTAHADLWPEQARRKSRRRNSRSPSTAWNSRRRRRREKSKFARRWWGGSTCTTFWRRSARASRSKFPPSRLKKGSPDSSSVPGRFQRIDEGQPFLVVVDYAHTDDALRNLIATARELSPSGRIITVFGAGGDRDRTKRPLMGEAAGSLSDLVVLTSDNPRSEDPLRIINDVVVGLQKVNAKYRDRAGPRARPGDRDRRGAPGDIVLLAGKGHETIQVLKDRTIEFDDREKAREILRRKGFAKAAGRALKRGFASKPGHAGILRRRGEAQPIGDAMRWTVVQVAEALGVAAPSGLDPLAGLAGVSIDSRTVQPGELFVAIHGPRHDGHDHVAGALASAALRPGWWRASARGVSGRNSAARFSPWTTRSPLCSGWPRGRARSGAGSEPGRLIAGVAGSVGKTTTKEILAALVGARFRVLKTQGNLNNEYGLPLTLLKLDDEYEAAVVELGMSHRGELAQLTRIASPDVGVVTRVAVEHLEFFASMDEIALAERELIENLPWPDATAVLNADDERVAAFAEVARGPVIYFGTQRGGGISRRGHRGARHRGLGV